MHCLGLLRAGAPGASAEAAARRAYLITRCDAPSQLLFEPPASVRRLPGRASRSQRGFTPETDLRRWADAQLEGLFLQLWELAQAAHPLGNLLFVGVPDAERTREVARCVTLATQLRAERDAAAAGDAAAAAESDADEAADGGAPEERRVARPAAAPLRIYSPRALAAAPDAPRLQASASLLRISRVGQFSCPLHCGAVLFGAPPRGGDATARARRAALASCVDESRMLRALDDATDLQTVRDASAAGVLPRIVHVGTSVAGTWAEFEPRGRAASSAQPGALWPVVWFAFTPRAEATARALQDEEAYRQALGNRAAADASDWLGVHAPPTVLGAADGHQLPVLGDEDRYDLLDMPLTARHGVAGMACAKLISGENLMADWGDDHAEPNIDATALEVHGFLAPQLPP